MAVPAAKGSSAAPPPPPPAVSAPAVLPAPGSLSLLAAATAFYAVAAPTKVEEVGRFVEKYGGELWGKLEQKYGVEAVAPYRAAVAVEAPAAAASGDDGAPAFLRPDGQVMRLKAAVLGARGLPAPPVTPYVVLRCAVSAGAAGGEEGKGESSSARLSGQAYSAGGTAPTFPEGIHAWCVAQTSAGPPRALEVELWDAGRGGKPSLDGAASGHKLVGRGELELDAPVAGTRVGEPYAPARGMGEAGPTVPSRYSLCDKTSLPIVPTASVVLQAAGDGGGEAAVGTLSVKAWVEEGVVGAAPKGYVPVPPVVAVPPQPAGTVPPASPALAARPAPASRPLSLMARLTGKR